MICRMCLLDSPETLDIFSENYSLFNILNTIAQHFWFVPKDDDPISTFICNDCWWKIESFHTYYLSVEEAHRKLSERFSVKPSAGFKSVQDKEIKVYLAVEKSEGAFNDNEKDIALIAIEPDLEEEGDIEENRNAYDPATDYFKEHFIHLKRDPTKEELIEGEVIEFEIEEAEPEVITNDEVITPTYPDDGELETVAEAASSSYPEDTEQSSKYLEAQKNLEEFIRIDTVSKSAEANHDDGKNGDDSDEEQLIVLNKRPRRSRSENNSESKIRMKKFKEDDRKMVENMKMKCDICGKESKTFAEVKGHYREVHNMKGYVVCCNKRFYKRVLALDHIERHLNPELFRCEECNKTYADKQCLKNHMLRHKSESEMFPCDQCDKRFVKQYLLDQHKVTHVPEEERQYLCDDCGKAFPTNNLLQTHHRYVHEKIYNQMCHICAKVIRGKEQFAKHQLEHAGVTDPKVECKLCGALLKNKHSLRKHLLRHEEANTEHKCNICGKTAPTKGALQSHIKYVHSADRPHKCSVCGKSFKKAIVLKEHMTIHTGEVLYTCSHCPRTFNSHANLHAHKKRSHRAEWEKERKSRQGQLDDSQAISQICENV